MQRLTLTFLFSLSLAAESVSFAQNYGADTTRTILLREVKVRPQKIAAKGDTLTFSVAGFKSAQDRTISDVLKKMPGIEVDESGQITFEGKPINRFYIEGMDLMGGKYALASENLRAGAVEKVQVLQNHQPVKSLRGVQFSEQAALNLVLKDEARGTWARSADAGAGATLGSNSLGDKPSGRDPLP